MRRIPWFTAAGLGLLLAAALLTWRVWLRGGDPAPVATPLPSPTALALATPQALADASPTATPSPTPCPTPSTLERLSLAEPPLRDKFALARQLGGPPAPPGPAASPPAPSYQVGDREVFWVSNLDAGETFTVTAVLGHISPHLCLWVEEAAAVEAEALARSAAEWEERIYPTNRRYFGEERSPGVDGDPRLHVLCATFTGAAGYFSTADAYPATVNPYSNQRDMFYLNLRYKTPGTDGFHSTLAHEFQHMIHWHADPNEEVWLSEGCAQLAEVLNGHVESVGSGYLAQPDTQLTTWAITGEGEGPYYDASYLFVAYLAERFGPDLLREVVQHPANGAAGIDAVLAARGLALTFEDLYADWAIANALDDPALAEGRYGYAGLDPRNLAAVAVRDYPATLAGEVRPYGVDYVELYAAQGELRLDFTGAITVPIVANQAHSGRYQWWANRGSLGAMTLTREFDLRDVAAATLRYWTWYDIEPDWDYAYLLASTDGGERWDILRTPRSVDTNPCGESYGPAYTGASGGWVEEAIDLAAYAGRRVAIRFAYITDDAVNHDGFCLDDLRIPEVGYAHDAESDDGGWVAEGFVRIDNALPQRFLAQLITLGDETRVRRLELGADNRAAWTVAGFGQEVERAVLVLSGLTPYTTQPAAYTLALSPN